MNEIGLVYLLIMLTTLGAIVLVAYQYSKSKIAPASIQPCQTISNETRQNLPFVCGRCGLGMTREDYVCPRCLSRDKRSR